MDRFYMADIIPLLPLPEPPQGKSSYYVPCPHCDRRRSEKDKHLNINLAKNVFRCARCGWSGGIFDLYAYYADIKRSKVRDELKRLLLRDNAISVKRKVTPTTVYQQESSVSSVASIDSRHAAYSALLSMLTLAPDHLRNLLGRGLSEEAIHANEYRTTPVVGGAAIAKHILGMGHSLAGVPGFYVGSNGQWMFISMWRGILVPVRDTSGRIQGLQVRRDNQAKRKYRWVSSSDIEGGSGGCGAEGWVHLAGLPRESVLLIEGPMKADIVHHLTGQSVVAIPGVNSLRHLERAMAELVELGVRKVMTAFDMDFLKNPNVQKGYSELVNLLGRFDLMFGTYLWHPDYNGLDDYIWEYCLRSSKN